MSGFFEAIEGIAAYLSESSLVFLVGLGVFAVYLGPDIIRAVVEIHRINKDYAIEMARLNLRMSRENLGKRRREAAGRDTAQGSEHHD